MTPKESHGLAVSYIVAYNYYKISLQSHP